MQVHTSSVVKFRYCNVSILVSVNCVSKRLVVIHDHGHRQYEPTLFFPFWSGFLAKIHKTRRCQRYEQREYASALGFEMYIAFLSCK